MSWIREERSGKPPIMEVLSINPKAQEAVGASNQAITFGASALTRVQEEAIATATASAQAWLMTAKEG